MATLPSIGFRPTSSYPAWMTADQRRRLNYGTLTPEETARYRESMGLTAANPRAPFTTPTGGAGGVGNTGGGWNVNLPLFGTGGERGGSGGGATGPGGATFGPGASSQPIPGSGLPPISFGTGGGLPVGIPGDLGPATQIGNTYTFDPYKFTPPTDPAAPASSASSGPVSAGTPTTPAKPPSAGGPGTVDEILAALKKWSPVIAAGGSLAANLRTGRQQGRRDEQTAANQTNVTNVGRYNAGLGGLQTDLLQRTYVGNNYDRNVDNAVRGDYMQGVQDLQIERPAGVPGGRISGGLRPSAFPNRAAIGSAMEKEAMTELLDPTRVASDPRPGTKRLPALPELPERVDAPGANAFDSVLDALSYAGASGPMIEALIKAMTPAPPTPTAADLPIAAPDPLVVDMPDVDVGTIPVMDPYASNRARGLIDTLNGPKRTRANQFGDPRF